ncbi:hypothetical protein [Bacillus sp. AFS029533]|uniref:hypothetical protein n=1 Tax=Bacillus sp. AFS029533 TaxID=2033494 RepID=UPI000BFD6E24|nr:hypothetical protein [Bacillus sp. AFS029533]PGZ92184.1 hypothetical protein COE53_12535 [Bacillus sp. AFS029533]
MKIISIDSEELLKDSTVEYIVNKISDFNSKLPSPYNYLIKLFSNENEKGYYDFLLMVNIYHEEFLKTDFNLFSISALYTDIGWTYYLTTHEGDNVLKDMREISLFLESIFNERKIKEYITDIKNLLENKEYDYRKMVVDEKVIIPPTNYKGHRRPAAIRNYRTGKEVRKLNGYISDFRTRGLAVAVENGILKISAEHSSVNKPISTDSNVISEVNSDLNRKLYRVNRGIKYLRSKGLSVQMIEGKLEIIKRQESTQVNNRRNKAIPKRQSKNRFGNRMY